MEAIHVSGVNNQVADALSRLGQNRSMHGEKRRLI